MKARIKAILIACLCCLFPGDKVTAQIGNPGLMYQGAFNNAMFLTTKSAIERGMNSKPENRGHVKSEQSVKTAAGMNFVSSAAVNDKVLELIASITANGDRNKAILAAKTIKNANFMGRFDAILSPYGLNRYNVPDVFTAFVLLSWQAITGNEIGNYRKGIELFRNQIHNAMGNNTKLAQLTNDQKQEIAEILSYMAMFFTYATDEQSKKGDTATMLTTKQNIRQAVIRVSGIDLTLYTFNNNGLIRN